MFFGKNYLGDIVSFSVHGLGHMIISLSRLFFGDVKFDHLVKVAFMAFVLIREDVTLKRREIRRAGRKSEEDKKKRLKGKLWSFIFPGAKTA